MNWISGAFFLLAAHSLFMVAFIPFNQDWYYQKAYEAGVEPNITAAIRSKLFLAIIGIGVGIWQLN